VLRELGQPAGKGQHAVTLEELLATATPGPWFANVDDLVGGFQVANRAVPASELDTRQGSPDRAVGLFLSKDDARLVALAPTLAQLALDMGDAIRALTFENYRGIVCAECGWNASFQPPEITTCLSCSGELVARITAKAYREHSDVLLARLDGISGDNP
jgi:hypothetical protein